MARFMSEEWAQTLAERINAWPEPEYRATKLEDFWAWIDAVKPGISGKLALSVRDLPGGGPDTLVFAFDAGTITAATVASRADAEAEADFLLAGDYDDWVSMLGGYDVGKTVMYRKLVLEKGETLLFFMAVFFWTEMLAAMQHTPVELLQTA
jgi:hypothetical protein